MSPLADDAVVTELRRRAADAPPMTLDPAAVLVAGRRHRRRAGAVRAAAGVAAAAAVVVGVAQLPAVLGDDRTAPPAARQEARPLGPDLVVALDRGVRAANRPVVTAGTSAGDVLGLGVLALPVEGDGAPEPPTLGVGPLQVEGDDASPTDGVTFTLTASGAGVSSAWDVRWDDEVAGPGVGGPSPASVEVGADGLDAQPGTYVAGAVPARLDTPRVLVDVAVLAADGTAVPGDGGLVELPTFASPAGDHLLYAAWVPDGRTVRTDREGTAPEAPRTLASAVVLLGDDGTVVVRSSRCTGQALATCPADVAERVTAGLAALGATPGDGDPTVTADGLALVGAADVAPAADAGAVDVGVEGTSDRDPGRWVLRVAGSPPTRTVAVERRAPTGAVLASGGATTTADSAGDPEWVAFSQDDALAVGGLLPPGFAGGTVDATLGWGADAPTLPLVAFDVPGVETPAWFVLATAGEGAGRGRPDLRVVMTAPDGRVATVRAGWS
ncbi:hypothetical protein [Actinotalea solisilvae]|uniref:hypothetical protein n=1 Tax=Actinotalea solisilvae TaxID=2072922 RepID=UPI0018F1BAC2|nr:hypothetical protein [Actinotalea solisilvae]